MVIHGVIRQHTKPRHRTRRVVSTFGERPFRKAGVTEPIDVIIGIENSAQLRIRTDLEMICWEEIGIPLHRRGTVHPQKKPKPTKDTQTHIDDDDERVVAQV